MSIVGGENSFLHFANVVDFDFFAIFGPVDDVGEDLDMKGGTFMISESLVTKEPLPLGREEVLGFFWGGEEGIMDEWFVHKLKIIENVENLRILE